MLENEFPTLQSIVQEETECHDPCFLGVDERDHVHFYSLARPLIVAVSPGHKVQVFHFDVIEPDGLSDWADHVRHVHGGWARGPRIADSDLDRAMEAL